MGGHLEIVKLLIEDSSYFLDIRDEEGWTPLSWAAAAGHLEVVKLLIKESIFSGNPEYNEGRLPLSWAAAGGHAEIVNLLIEDSSYFLDIRDRGSDAALVGRGGRALGDC